MLHRLVLTVITIFFPPLTVLILTGPYTDTLLNSILFLCGVIPSHLHAFYISCTYFHRKRKVRKGKWPGPPKALIFDRKIWYGGAKEWEVEELKAGKVNEGRSSGGTSPVIGDAGIGVSRTPSARNHGYGQQSQMRRSGGYDRRSRSGDGAYDRRSQRVAAGYDRCSHMNDGLSRRRSVLGEVSRRV